MLIWSDVVVCPSLRNNTTTYADVRVRYSPSAIVRLATPAMPADMRVPPDDWWLRARHTPRVDQFLGAL